MKNKEIIFIYNMADILQTISINTIISKKNKCEYDYKLDSIKKLEKTLIEVKSDKFEKIQ